MVGGKTENGPVCSPHGPKDLPFSQCIWFHLVPLAKVGCIDESRFRVEAEGTVEEAEDKAGNPTFRQVAVMSFL